MTKDERVAAEEQRLMALFAGADENKLDFIRNHVQQLAWVNVSILDLQAEVDSAGAVVPFQNGRNQSGLQQNPACKLLIDYQKLSNTSFRALLPVLPEKPKSNALDELRQFNSEPMTKEEQEEAYQQQMEQLALIRQGININE